MKNPYEYRNMQEFELDVLTRLSRRERLTRCKQRKEALYINIAWSVVGISMICIAYM